MSDGATNWSQWESLICEIIRDSLNELGEIIEAKIKQNIDEHVYKYEPAKYERTYEFRESWTVTAMIKGNDFDIVIKSDPTKMTLNQNKFQHGSIYNKNGQTIETDVREYLPEILAFNLSGRLFDGFNDWWKHRTSYFDVTVQQLHAGGWLNKKFKELLRQRGLTVK
jgi:hypothetical protein